jgi:phosphohistidine phosphatase SixA
MAIEEIAEDKVVRLVVVRHGERKREGGELAPLTAGGRWQAETLGSWLQSVSMLTPKAILCSGSRHAHEHASIVSGILPRGVPVVTVPGLTPHASEADVTFAAIRREAAKTIQWGHVDTVTCIGHEPRLHQLVHKMTGERPEALRAGEVLCVEGDSWEALDSGRGHLGIRTEPAGLQQGDDADLLPKIQSKVQTSALLAGFSSTVFGVVLTQSDYWTTWSDAASWPSGTQAWKAALVTMALVCLALATLLFVVSIYMYDRLAMPQRYWEAIDEEKPPRQERWRSFRRDRLRCGLLYAYMVWVWRFVFSVAVATAMLGFLALVMYRGVWPVAVLYLFALAAAVTYYFLFRPELGVD